MLAAAEGHLSCLAMLLAAGADPAALNSDCLTALELVASRNNGEIRALLRLTPPTVQRAAAWAKLPEDQKLPALDQAVAAAEALVENSRQAAVLAVEQGVRGLCAAHLVHRTDSRASQPNYSLCSPQAQLRSATKSGNSDTISKLLGLEAAALFIDSAEARN